jgi:hypothetical protein
MAIECKWSAGAWEPAGLKAFRLRYPEGRSFVVAPDVTRPYTRAVGPSEVEYVALGTLIERLGA